MTLTTAVVVFIAISAIIAVLIYGGDDEMETEYTESLRKASAHATDVIRRVAQQTEWGVDAHYDGVKTADLADVNAEMFKRACLAEAEVARLRAENEYIKAEVARLRTLFRELLEHVSRPFVAYHDAESALQFVAESYIQTVDYVHNTAKEALYDGQT